MWTPEMNTHSAKTSSEEGRAIVDSAEAETIGAGIKRFRRQKKWSLKTLSERSGVPISTLSKVENGVMSLKIEKLLAVSSALGVDVMQLVAPAENASPVVLVTGRRSITRADSAPKTRTDNTTYSHHAHDFSRRRFSPVVIDVLPGRNPQLIRHEGEEFIFVLEGRVEALTEYYEPTILEKGDSMYIDSTMAHNIRALDNRPARVLNVSSVRRFASGDRNGAADEPEEE